MFKEQEMTHKAKIILVQFLTWTLYMHYTHRMV